MRNTEKSLVPTPLFVPSLEDIAALAIMGFDLGKHKTGWALVVGGDLMDRGSFEMDKVDGLVDLFHGTSAEVSRILKQYLEVIDVIGFEFAIKQPGRATPVFQTMMLGLLVAASDLDIPCYTVAPSQVKKAATGDGRAKGKQPVIDAINERFGIELTSSEDDLADAIGAALAIEMILGQGRARPAI